MSSVNVIVTLKIKEYTQNLHKDSKLIGIFKHSRKLYTSIIYLISGTDKGETLPKEEGEYIKSNLPY